MQSSTRRAVLELVRRDRARTRSDLSSQIGLSRSAVAQLVAELVAEGLLVEHSEPRHDRLGRPATRLALVPRQGFVGAVDLGHGHLAVALGNLHQDVLAQRRQPRPADQSPREALAAAVAALDAMLAVRGARRADLSTVGVGVPFPVVDRVVVPVGDVPAWAGVRPAELLALPRDVRVVVGNDSNLAAWAEYVEAGDQVGSLLYVSAGDGVGGAFVVDGELFAGRHGVSGEVGHVRVPGCRQRCRCGRVGCLDALVTAAAAPGAARRELYAAAQALGVALAGLTSFVDPELVVLGGTLGGAGSEFSHVVAESFARHDPLHRATFRPARLGPHAALRGAIDRATEAAWSRA